jgi:hypothetical protein
VEPASFISFGSLSCFRFFGSHVLSFFLMTMVVTMMALFLMLLLLQCGSRTACHDGPERRPPMPSSKFLFITVIIGAVYAVRVPK